MTIIEEYIENQKKYEKEYGKRTIFLIEVGSFFEYYGIINVPEGKTETSMTEEEKIQNRWGAIWDVASDDILKMTISRRNNWKYRQRGRKMWSRIWFPRPRPWKKLLSLFTRLLTKSTCWP